MLRRRRQTQFIFAPNFCLNPVPALMLPPANQYLGENIDEATNDDKTCPQQYSAPQGDIFLLLVMLS